MSLQLNVGGDWEFCFDPEEIGISKNWFVQKPPKTKTITLPHLWSYEAKPTEPCNVAFYFKTFTVDKSESAKRFFIRFDSILHQATVWLNGEEIGSQMGGFAPFDLDASKQINIEGDNHLCVRIEKPDDSGYLNDMHILELPMGFTYYKAPYAGILGDIHFLMGGRAGIQSINCFPDYEADWVTIETKFWNPKNYKAELEFTVTTPDGKEGTFPKLVKLEKENGTHSITFSLEKAQIWSPEKPKLYKIKVNLIGSYAMESVFGMRRVEIERCNIKINHKITKLRGVNLNQIYPFHNILPVDPIDREKELQSIMDAGFNVIRSCGQPFDNATLDICDRIGLMAIQETTCYNQKSNKDILDNLKDQIRALMQSTGYHPSLIMWAIGAENGSMVLENGNKLLRFASELDPYRPILSNMNSVFMDSNGKGKIDLGKVYDPTESKIEPYESHKLKIAFPLAIPTQNMLTSYCSSKEAKSINDGVHGGKSFWERYNYLKEELGGKVLVDGLGVPLPSYMDKMLSSAITKKHGAKSPMIANMADYKDQLTKAIKKVSVWKNVGEFIAQAEELCMQGLTQQMDSYLTNTQFGGYFFENWADYQNNFAGLVDHYRRPKPILDVVKNLNSKIRIMSSAEGRTPYTGTSAAMNIFILNEGGLHEYGLLLRVKGPNGRIWHQESMPGKASRGVNSIGRFKFPVGNEKGWFTFDLTLSEDKKDISKKEELFFVPPKVELDPILKTIEFHGEFSKSITYNAQHNSDTIVINQLHTLEDGLFTQILEKVSQGGQLILGSLTPEDAETLNNQEVFPDKISCFRSSWTDYGSYHYALDCPEFAELPNNGILNQAYADVLPIWSLELPKTTDVLAGSVNLYDAKLGKTKVKLGLDLGVRSFGKGKIIFNQFRILEQLGTNALADVMFANLIKTHQK